MRRSHLYYYPRNETAWTDSPHITIVPEGEDSDGPQLLRMDGDYLINPFGWVLSSFYRINWGIVGLQVLHPCHFDCRLGWKRQTQVSVQLRRYAMVLF